MLNYCSDVNVLMQFLKGFCKGEGRANMLRAINRVHTGWQQQSALCI